MSRYILRLLALVLGSNVSGKEKCIESSVIELYTLAKYGVGCVRSWALLTVTLCAALLSQPTITKARSFAFCVHCYHVSHKIFLFCLL